MLLVMDVGNTNITLGVFDGEELQATFRMTTKSPRTSDEYGIFFCDLLEHRGLRVEMMEDVIIASVVPGIMYSLTSAVIKYFGKEPILVGSGTKTGIRIATTHPQQVGADRIVDAVGAYQIYGGPVIVVDFGTATTYDLVLADGTFTAGVTAPGIGMAANALSQGAAKLPQVEIKKPPSILAKETISSMQAGLIYGAIGQTEYIIDRMIKESGLSDVKVVATGGMGKLIADETEKIQHYDADLTLKGLMLVHKRCKKK